MIVVNRFTKRAYFVSFHKKMNAEKVAYLFKQHIIANHEVLCYEISRTEEYHMILKLKHV